MANVPISALQPRTADGHQFVLYGDCCSGVPGSAHARNFAAVNAALLRLLPLPGHTPGLLTMQVDTQNSGVFMLNSDLYHVRDVFEQNLTQGWLGRDSHAWHRSVKAWLSCCVPDVTRSLPIVSTLT